MSGINLGKNLYLISKLICKKCSEGNKYKTTFINYWERQKFNALKIVHLNVYCPIMKTFIEGARYFVKGVDLHVEVQKVVLETFQGVEGLCRDRTEIQNQGTSIG